jgi:fused signal recognition particle receptor
MGFFDKLKNGLAKARENVFGSIKTLFSGKILDDELLEELEELLITSDMGMETTNNILSELKKRYKKDKTEDSLILLRDIMVENLSSEEFVEKPINKPHVIFVVGVNGSGKTTSIAKISNRYIKDGKTVVIAAADTFRAAAIEQIKHWGEKVGATVISHTKGSDAASVAYDSLIHAKSKNKDIVIIDTAGRLHTNSNLMEEMKKIKRVISKELPNAPHETLLVIDGTTGQNGIAQAKLFKEAVDVSGIILTKLDGTAKGGVAFSIYTQLGIPIKMIAVGEKEDDYQMFDPKMYCDALLGIEEKQ